VLEAIAASGRELELEQLRKSFWIRLPARGVAGGGDAARPALRALQRTDKGNAERWIARFGEDYLYTTAKGWLGWDGRRYRVLNQEKDTTPAEVLASVFEMVEAIQREADFVARHRVADDEEIAPDLLAELEEDPRRDGGMDGLIGCRQQEAERLSAKLKAWALASEAAGRINCIPGLVKRG
jgi:DNA primase